MEALHNPAYFGDYFAQSKNELSSFNRILDNCISLKNSGNDMPETRRMVYSEWPRYSFRLFQIDANNKLSSSNNTIYIVDLDELYLLAIECIQKYIQLIDKPLNEIKERFLRYSVGEYELGIYNDYWFAHEALFCFELINYYENKRSIFKGNDADSDSYKFNKRLQENTDFYNDKNLIIKRLGDSLLGASQKVIDNIIQHILSCKYDNIEKPDFYCEFKFKVSQNYVSKQLGLLKEDLKLGKNGREELSVIFSSIPQYLMENGNYFKFTKTTLYKGMNITK